jgi:hypothetical protein
MAQDIKSMFAKMGFGDNVFAWPKAGGAMPMPDMGNWVRTQQEIFAAFTKFSQDAVTRAKSDAELGGEVMRRLMAAKTPEEFAATQRDMFELVSSKFFDQWTKFGEQMQTAFAKTTVPAVAAEVETVTKAKKAA